jgi:hypothetical protein
LLRFHEKLEDYHIDTPVVQKGIDKIKDAVNSYLDHRELPAEVADVVNKVSNQIQIESQSS